VEVPLRTSLLVSSAAAALLFAAMVTPASAQTAPPTHPFVIHAQTGVTFPTPGGALFGAGAGVALDAVPGLTVFGELGKITNVMTGELQDIADTLFNVDAAEEQGIDFELDVDLPTTYFVGGARYHVRTNGPLGVFVEGGFGIGRVGLDVRLVVEDPETGEDVDVSEAFEAALEAQGGVEPSTEALFIIGGGVNWPLTDRVDVTGGLRLSRVSAADGITKTALYVGLLWRP
jgi:hypothetical protein